MIRISLVEESPVRLLGRPPGALGGPGQSGTGSLVLSMGHIFHTTQGLSVGVDTLRRGWVGETTLGSRLPLPYVCSSGRSVG